MKRLIYPLALALAFFACHASPPAAPQITGQNPVERIQQDIAHLSELCPLGFAVEIDIRPIAAPVWGRTHFDGDHWVIEIDPSGGLEQVHDTLIHEWAHALAGNGGGPLEPSHGAIWG